METIATLVELALKECYEATVTDWYPDENPPESYQGACEIEMVRSQVSYDLDGCQQANWLGDWYVILNGVFCIIDMESMQCWHSDKIVEEAFA